MSRFKPFASKLEANANTHQDKAVVNFMGGTSYMLNPLDNLHIIAASSIFGEPSYYRSNSAKKAASPRDNQPKEEILRDLLAATSLGGEPLLKSPFQTRKQTFRKYLANPEYNILSHLFDSNKEWTTDEIFSKAIDQALEYDFAGTLDLAVKLRQEYHMRLNPSVILVRAARHPQRVQFTQNRPGAFGQVAQSILQRPDDVINQFEYWMYLHGRKNNLPDILKRAWRRKLSSLDSWQIYKYKSPLLIDTIRICHATSEPISEYVKTGTVLVKEEQKNWEALKAQGKTWREIIETIELPHMALLRNLRGIFKEIEDAEIAKKLIEKLKKGVSSGRQFPFRYYTALQNIAHNEEVNHRPLLITGLEECMDAAMENFPKLKGKTICLSDNSGSAWGAFNSEYGSVKVAEIGNLSSLMTAYNCEEGYVGVFGDRLKILPISVAGGILSQLEKINETGKEQGGATENGIWLFFKEAIEKGQKYDNIFIYSDQQAGHGGLYGQNQQEYKEYISGSSYIDVLKLVLKYRATVNPKVNVFSIQTAGYDNSLLPENLYRGAILAGWTGREAVFAKEIINFWDQKEA